MHSEARSLARIIASLSHALALLHLRRRLPLRPLLRPSPRLESSFSLESTFTRYPRTPIVIVTSPMELISWLAEGLTKTLARPRRSGFAPNSERWIYADSCVRMPLPLVS